MNQKQELLSQVLQPLPKNKLLTIDEIANAASVGEYLTNEELISMLKNYENGCKADLRHFVPNVSEVTVRQIFGKLFSYYVIRE